METVAITDYTFDTLEIEKSILEPLGCRIVEQRSGKDIQKLISLVNDADYVITQFAPMNAEVVAAMRRPAPFDLVLLDVQLPDVDGFFLLARMREHPVLKYVPVIMLTASATPAAVLKGLQLGADGYVTKPFQLDPLMKAVHTVLGLAEPEASQPGPWGRGKPGSSSRTAR